MSLGKAALGRSDGARVGLWDVREGHSRRLVQVCMKGRCEARRDSSFGLLTRSGSQLLTLREAPWSQLLSSPSGDAELEAAWRCTYHHPLKEEHPQFLPAESNITMNSGSKDRCCS